MDHPSAPFDIELIRRYDVPGPRYTSYPTAPQFSADFGEPQLREAIDDSNGDPIPRPLSIYVHVPFCESPCFYCGCNRIITRDKSRSTPYLARLERELDMFAAAFDPDREVVQVHFGGGTPNFFSPAQLSELVQRMRARFRFGTAELLDVSIELDPRFVTPDEIAQLAHAGFNRASLGVQDFDPAVQEAVNRVQSIAETEAIVKACRDTGFQSVNIDLIYGLPHQTLEGFGRTLDEIARIRPDRLAVYSYAHMPHLFRPQKQIDGATLPAPETKLALLALAVERLTAEGYVYIGMDHFALPEDSLTSAQANRSLHRNFMGYTTHAGTDLVGLGVSAISAIGGTFSQNPRTLPEWEAAVDAARLPVWRGMRLTEDDRIRADTIQQLMCHGLLDKLQFTHRNGVPFDEYFTAALPRLRELRAEGLITGTDPVRIEVSGQGRYLLRIIAMCFDAYLKPAGDQQPRFSQAI